MQTTTTYIALLSALSFSAAEQQVSIQAPQSATANDFIEVFKQLSGEHPGIRKGHAKGVCALGSFEPSATAQARFDTPLFSEQAPITLRFSMGGGNPNADEAANDQLPCKTSMISLSGFLFFGSFRYVSAKSRKCALTARLSVAVPFLRQADKPTTTNRAARATHIGNR